MNTIHRVVLFLCALGYFKHVIHALAPGPNVNPELEMFTAENRTFPLTANMIKVIDELALHTDITSFGRLFQKLDAGKAVAVVIIGGSFADGAGCRMPSPQQCRWVYRFIQWLAYSYPQSSVKLISKTIPSTSSFIGLAALEQIPEPFDLLLVDYSLNDYFLVQDEKQHASLLVITEMIVRLAFMRNSAVLYIAELQVTSMVEDAYNVVLSNYSVPLLSYRAVIIEDVRLYVPLIRHSFPPQWATPLSQFHPRYPTHCMLAQTVAHYMTRLAERVDQASSPPVTELSTLLPSAIFSGKEVASVQSNSYCTPALTSMSSLLDGNDVHNFTPFQRLHHEEVNYFNGWRFASDLPGKPQGWISDGDRSEGSNMSRIAFAVALIKGEVSITYLETHRNAGRMEVWLTYIDPANRHGALFSSDKSLLGCCNKSKVSLYPDHEYPQASASAWIDTYRNNGISAIVTKTLRFTYKGLFLVNIRHERSSDEEYAARGGDKVKVVGIRGC